jgi:hypothetical protein
MFGQSGANGDGDRENDRKDRFHGTKVFVAARSRAFIRWSSRLHGGSPMQSRQTQSPFCIGEGLTLAAMRVSNATAY